MPKKVQQFQTGEVRDPPAVARIIVPMMVIAVGMIVCNSVILENVAGGTPDDRGVFSKADGTWQQADSDGGQILYSMSKMGHNGEVSYRVCNETKFLCDDKVCDSGSATVAGTVQTTESVCSCGFRRYWEGCTELSWSSVFPDCPDTQDRVIVFFRFNGGVSVISLSLTLICLLGVALTEVWRNSLNRRRGAVLGPHWIRNHQSIWLVLFALLLPLHIATFTVNFAFTPRSGCGSSSTTTPEDYGLEITTTVKAIRGCSVALALLDLIGSVYFLWVITRTYGNLPDKNEGKVKTHKSDPFASPTPSAQKLSDIGGLELKESFIPPGLVLSEGGQTTTTSDGEPERFIPPANCPAYVLVFDGDSEDATEDTQFVWKEARWMDREKKRSGVTHTVKKSYVQVPLGGEGDAAGHSSLPDDASNYVCFEVCVKDVVDGQGMIDLREKPLFIWVEDSIMQIPRKERPSTVTDKVFVLIKKGRTLTNAVTKAKVAVF